MSQIDVFGNEVKNPPKPINKEKRNWEAAFQRWSNRESMDGRTSYGACGYGSMCDHCNCEPYGHPCVRALNAMCREKGITIDYTRRNFEDIWNGHFNDVQCKDCGHLMFSDCYGECSMAYKGIVSPDDSCGKGVRKK